MKVPNLIRIHDLLEVHSILADKKRLFTEMSRKVKVFNDPSFDLGMLRLEVVICEEFGIDDQEKVDELSDSLFHLFESGEMDRDELIHCLFRERENQRQIH